MSKKIKTMWIVLTILIAALACVIIIFTKSGNMVLEYKDVSAFDTQEISTVKNNRQYILISGESNSSSLNIGEIKETLENKDIIVRVYTTLSRTDNKDGSFMHAVKIDDNIDRILFGDEQKVIWNK